MRVHTYLILSAVKNQPTWRWCSWKIKYTVHCSQRLATLSVFEQRWINYFLKGLDLKFGSPRFKTGPVRTGWFWASVLSLNKNATPHGCLSLRWMVCGLHFRAPQPLFPLTISFPMCVHLMLPPGHTQPGTGSLAWGMLDLSNSWIQPPCPACTSETQFY